MAKQTIAVLLYLFPSVVLIVRAVYFLLLEKAQLLLCSLPYNSAFPY